MTKQEQEDFKKLVKESVVAALDSKEGQEAIVSALNSEKGQGAIVSALNSGKGQETLVKSFVEGYHKMVEPMLEDIWHDVKNIKIELKYVKDKYGTKIERLERKTGLVI